MGVTIINPGGGGIAGGGEAFNPILAPEFHATEKDNIGGALCLHPGESPLAPPIGKKIWLDDSDVLQLLAPNIDPNIKNSIPLLGGGGDGDGIYSGSGIIPLNTISTPLNTWTIEGAGIGGATPHVMDIFTPVAGGIISFGRTGGTQFYLQTLYGLATINSRNNYPLTFKVANVEAARFDTNRDFVTENGIGVRTPPTEGALHIRQLTSEPDGGLVLQDPAGPPDGITGRIYTTTSNSFAITKGNNFRQIELLGDGMVAFNSMLGIRIGDGADADQDLITVFVTGNPKLWWNEVVDAFEMNKTLILPIGSLIIGTSALTEIGGKLSAPGGMGAQDLDIDGEARLYSDGLGGIHFEAATYRIDLHSLLSDVNIMAAGNINLSSTGGGNIIIADFLGVGTPDPEAPVHLKSSIDFGGDDFIIEKLTNVATGLKIKRGESGGSYNESWYLYIPESSNDLRIYGNGDDRLILTNAGDITVYGETILDRHAVVGYRAMVSQIIGTLSGINDSIISFPVANAGVQAPAIIDFDGTTLEVKQRHPIKFGTTLVSLNFSNSDSAGKIITVNSQVSYDGGTNWFIADTQTFSISSKSGAVNGYTSSVMSDYINPQPSTVPALARWQIFADGTGVSLMSASFNIKGRY